LAEEVQTITVTGRVVDYQARPVAGATVVCYERKGSPLSFELLGRAYTTSDGRFSLQVETEGFFTCLVAGKQGLALGWKEIERAGNTTIRLGRPSLFKGTVMDEAGRPVPGAKVRICLKNEMMARREIAPLLPEGWYTTRTDAQGQFLFDNVPEGSTADFGVEAPGRASTWTTCDFGLRQGEQFAAGRTDIRTVLPPEACIKGQVVDEHTGRRLAGVRILARPISHPNWQYCLNEVHSDQNGRFELTGLAPDKYLLSVMSPKEGAGHLTVTVEPGQEVCDARVPLTGVPFEVIVCDQEKGYPLENASVTVTQKEAVSRYTTFSQKVTTDANGLARLRVPPGECEVQAVKPGHGMTFEPQRLRLDPGQALRHEVFLPRTAYILSGEVLDEQGRVLRGASVMQKGFGPRTLTDANGQFDTSDTHFFVSRFSSRTRVLARHTPSGLGAIADLRDATKSDKFHGRIVLKPAYVLTGRVTDPNGRSVPAAYVKLRQGRYRTPITEVPTDANGVYCIRSVPPQEDNLKYVIVAYAEGFGLTQISQIPFHDDTARPVRLDPIVLRPADQVVSGVVEDSNNQPVAGALVEVYGPRLSSSFSQPPCGKTLADAQGRFRIAGVCKEPLQIEAVSPPPQKQQGVTWAHGGNENIRVVLGQKLIFSASLIGKPLPELEDLKIELSPTDADDKMILICFWDMEQRPSRYCIRELAKRAEELKEKGIAVVAVQASKVDENTLNQWVKDYNIPCPVRMVWGDEEKTRFTWGVRSLPWLILTDRKHIVLAEGFGIHELDKKIAEAALRKKTVTYSAPIGRERTCLSRVSMSGCSPAPCGNYIQ